MHQGALANSSKSFYQNIKRFFKKLIINSKKSCQVFRQLFLVEYKNSFQAMWVARLRVAGCAFRAKLRVARLRVASSKKLQRLRSVRIAKVALFGRWLRPLETQPATRNFFRFSLGARACVCVPYIYKIKIKKKNIPIGLRLRVRTDTEKYSKIQRRVAGCRLRSAIGGLLHFFMQLLTDHYFPNTKAIPSERYPIELSQSS